MPSIGGKRSYLEFQSKARRTVTCMPMPATTPLSLPIAAVGEQTDFNRLIESVKTTESNKKELRAEVQYPVTVPAV
jgi:hypothetical protein